MSPTPRSLRSTEVKKKEFAQKALDFSLDNKGSFVLLADPDTDLIFMAYRGFAVPIQFKTPEGKNMRIVSDALHYKKGAKGERSIDQFLLAVDSGLVNISEALYSAKKKTLSGKALEFVGLDKDERPIVTPEGIKSPLQMKKPEGE